VSETLEARHLIGQSRTRRQFIKRRTCLLLCPYMKGLLKKICRKGGDENLATEEFVVEKDDYSLKMAGSPEVVID
jgi:hypothetical protein